jgi:dipeptidyl aminopeptidase/acylaminoacyl peptidase
VRFAAYDGLELSGWLYGPHGASGPGPIVLSFHGGPEGQERPAFNPTYQYFLSRGYAVLAPNVRGSTGFGKTYTHLDDVKLREDSVKDLAAAVEWLKTSGGADARRVAVMGGSYGGYMTLAAITLYPDLWAAAIEMYGISNFETNLRNTSGYRRRQREREYGTLAGDLEFLRSVSPIYKVNRIKAPLLVFQGKNDPRVPYTESEQIVKALRDRNAPVEYTLFDDEGHGFVKLTNRLVVYPKIVDFLERHMK